MYALRIRAATPTCVEVDVDGAAVSEGGERREAVQLGAGRCAEVGAGRPVPVSARRLFEVAAAVGRNEVARGNWSKRRREEVYLVGRKEGHLYQYIITL